MTKKRIFLLLVAVLIIVASVILVVYQSIANQRRTAILDIVIAPKSALAKLNGKNVKPGIRKVVPGTYTLTVSKDGFATSSANASVGAKETKFLGVALIPNRDDTKSWYAMHPDDQLLLESITSRNSDQDAEVIFAENPIYKLLPVIGINESFRIDAGVSRQGNDKPALYVRSLSEQNKQAALQWIKDQGADPSKFEIIYINEQPTLF